MRSRFLILPTLLLLCFVVSAQNIQYTSYVSSNGPFGQPNLRYQYADNILYSANKRFTVSATGVSTLNEDMLFDGNYDQNSNTITAGNTAVFTIDFTGQPFAYPGGKVIANFYSQGNPSSISGRIQRNDDVWFDLTDWTNISIRAGYFVWQGTAPNNFNYCKKLELTIVNNHPTQPLSITELEYVLTRPSYEPGLVIKHAVNTLYKDLNWRGTGMVLNASIKPDGTAYFRNRIGINTTTPDASLHIMGDAIISTNLKPGSLTITSGAAAGKVLTSDASGNATWQVSSSGAGGWGLGGTSLGTGGEKLLGTLDDFALPIVTNNKVRMRISNQGNIGIGDDVATVGNEYRLYVDGHIRTRKVRVDNNNWPDYVFQPSYSLMPLQQLEKFIRDFKHLPEVPSAVEVHATGLDLSDNQAVLLKKIEELTLYIIDQNKKLEQQQARIEALEQKTNK